MKKYLSNTTVVLILLANIAILGGCSLSGPTLTQYMLTPSLPTIAMCATPLPVQMIVATPESGSDLDTDRIALIFGGREVRYLADAKWDTSAPRMIQRLIIQYLSAGNCFIGIGTSSAGINADYRLLMDIERLHLNYTDVMSVPTAEIRLYVSILELKTGKMIGQKRIQETQQSATTGRIDMMRAFDTVTTKAMVECTEWTFKTVESAEQIEKDKGAGADVEQNKKKR